MLYLNLHSRPILKKVEQIYLDRPVRQARRMLGRQVNLKHKKLKIN